MSLHQFLSILRARRVLAGLILLAVAASALGWALLRPLSYEARAPVLLDVRTDPTGSTPIQGMVSPSYVASQIDIAKSPQVAVRAMKLLADQQPMPRLRQQARENGLPEQWIVEALQGSLEVKPARESNIIHFSGTGASPAEAARVANAFAQAYLDTHLDLRTAPAKRYTEWFDQQVSQARDRLDRAQARLAEYQQKAGIISSTEQGDYERQHLAELSAQLLAATTRPRASAQSGPGELGHSPVVDHVRGEVARLESKVQEAATTLGANHPRMQQLQAELRAMRARLSAESERASRAAAASAQSSASRIRELQEQVAAQKARILSTSRQRGDLSVMQQEVESAQKAYDTVAASAAQSRLQSAATQGSVLFLGEATEPLRPTGSTPLQALVIGLGGGLLLAIAGALLAELANRRVRSVEDLQAATDLPILGIVPVPKARIARMRLSQAPRRLALQDYRSLA